MTRVATSLPEGILNARLEDGDVHHTVCPVPRCNLQLSHASVQSLLSKGQYARFKDLLAKRYADSNPGIRWYIPLGWLCAFPEFDSLPLAQTTLCNWNFFNLLFAFCAFQVSKS